MTSAGVRKSRPYVATIDVVGTNFVPPLDDLTPVHDVCTRPRAQAHGNSHPQGEILKQ